MNETQKDLLFRTAALLKPFRPLRTLLNAVIATAVVLAVLFFAAELWDWRLALAVLGMTIAYDFGKDAILRFWTKRRLIRQCEHVLSRYPATTRYIPLAENQGGLFTAKPAGIALEADSAWFITFQQPLFSAAPRDSIRVSAETEFRITGFDESLGKPWLSFKADLLSRALHLAIPNEPDLAEKIRGLAPHLQKEA